MSLAAGGPRSIERRGFLKTSTFLGGGAVGLGMTPMCSAVAQAVDDLEVVSWNSCTVNCGSRCPLKVVAKRGQVVRIEPQSDVPDGCEQPQARACLRGRAFRQRLYSEERLKYPMKRVGKRGEGKFERISWDEALDAVAAALKKTIATYGNEAIYYQYGSGNYALVSSRNAAMRLLTQLGGYLSFYGDYSAGQQGTAWPYLYGEGIYGADSGSQFAQIASAKLYLSFGNNNAVTRGSGIGQTWELACARQAGKARMVLIDPIYTDSMLGKEDQWVAIRPGTDAALCEGIAHVLITENLVDQAFLDRYCVGYDDKTLPASAPKNGDYKSYILGKGADGVAKTPAWASKITGVPRESIVKLAREIGTTKPVFISQGWGSQRQANGEQTTRAIAMLTLLTGNLGLPGTSTGGREGDASLGEVALPRPANPVKAQISHFLWTDAIERGPQMTAKRDGVRGVDQLKVPIKFMWVQQSNTLINQHADTNKTHRILQDDSKCEFIVVIDNQMTPSARYADILLPDVMPTETADIAADAYATGRLTFMVAMQQAVKPRFEERPAYEICRGIAQRFGIEDKFTEGRTQFQWVEWCYEQTRKKHPSLPTFEAFWRQGLVRVELPNNHGIALKAFREDPEKNRLKTPSGKVEIYSERLAKIAAEWELPPGDVITPLPQYVATWESHQDRATATKYPLQAFGYHGHGRTHSTYHNVPWLRELHPDQLLINPVDAAPRGLADGDRVMVFNDRGRIQLPLRVTPRIMPGVVALPQGAWYRPNGNGTDEGANINTLTSHRPSPLAKSNPQHTNLVEVRKA
ncbi:MAG: molybdopterin-dependent oxidoreductase [Burkholderiaceae bacterium]|nr:molybdopterin-dependent oxidoreductase [Burkholderiaceae bacterium]